MDPNTVLSQLRDIQSPEVISAWPPALGWWLLALGVLCALGLLTYLLLRWCRQTAWRRAALKELKKLEADYLANPDSQHLASLIALLKRSLAAAYQSPSVTALGPEQWRQRLGDAGHFLSNEDLTTLSEGHYQAQQPLLDKAAFKRIKSTIKEVR